MVRGIRKDTGELLESNHVQLFDGVGWAEVEPDTVDGRPKGRWKNDGHCSCCGMRNPTCRTDDLADYFPVPDLVFQRLQFCPDCGADMRGE